MENMTRRGLGVLAIIGVAVLALVSLTPRSKATLPVGAPLAGIVSCGSSATCATPTQLAGGVVTMGTATLATGTVTITGLPDFSSGTSYVCTWSDQTTAANGIGKVVYVSASSITITSNITSGNSDSVSYVCVGN